MIKLNTKKFLVPVALLSGYLGAQVHNFYSESQQERAKTIEVYFSPKGGCTQAIVDAIDNASSVILIQAYSFTSIEIIDALIAAVKRGVMVHCIMDWRETRGRGSKAEQLSKGINDFVIDKPSGLAHSKVMIIDSKIVITGSFNFTQAAENRNVENLLIIRNSQIAKKYTSQWKERRAQCVDSFQRKEIGLTKG